MSEGALDDNPVRLFRRHVVQERLRLLFPPGVRVLDLGEHGGDDAAFLTARGVRVLGREADPRDLDGAYAPPGSLSDRDLPEIGARLARAVRPGGRVLLCLANVGPARARHVLSAIRWTSLRGFGFLIPPPARAEWVRRHPQAFGLLAALEGMVGSWPGLRALGDDLFLEGRVVGVPPS